MVRKRIRGTQDGQFRGKEDTRGFKLIVELGSYGFFA